MAKTHMNVQYQFAQRLICAASDLSVPMYLAILIVAAIIPARHCRYRLPHNPRLFEGSAQYPVSRFIFTLNNTHEVTLHCDPLYKFCTASPMNKMCRDFHTGDSTSTRHVNNDNLQATDCEYTHLKPCGCKFGKFPN